MDEHSEHWMQRIVDRLDRLIEIGESLKGEVRLPSEEEAQTFADAEEPAKEAEYPAGPMPEPGEGYRLLSKDPPEDLRDGDEFFHSTLGRWRESINAEWGYKRQDSDCWYRRKIEVAKPPEPAWEPKVGDWVRVTRPENWKGAGPPGWSSSMHQFDGKIGQIECEYGRCFRIRGFDQSGGYRLLCHRNWLSPAEPPAIAKPPKPEYREPVLPADAGRWCEFSNDDNDWTAAKLRGYAGHLWQSISSEVVGTKHWAYARIKKES